MRALTGSWPLCPTCGNRGKPDPPTGTKCARLATGVPGRIPSKAFGATCFCGFRKTPTSTPRICWQNYAAYPGRFEDAQLRTLQRRVKDWRGVMAKGLIYAASDDSALARSEKAELALVGVGNKG